MKISISKFIPAIIWFIICTVLFTLPGSAFPKASWLDAIYFDKMVHIGLFFMLVLLIFWPLIYLNAPIRKKRILLVLIAGLALLYGVAIEFIQKYWIPNRSFDVFDIMADGIGSFLPQLLLKWLIKHKK